MNDLSRTTKPAARSISEFCGACGAIELIPHLAVAGEAGEAGLVPTTSRFGVALDDIVKCRLCGHMQLERMPTEAELSSAYEQADSDDYIQEEAGQRATAAALLDRLEAHARPGKLLDLGCWVGFLLAEARSRGWDGLGVEPSNFASSFARERLGLDVRTCRLTEMDAPEASFDAIVMCDVIEHLPDARQALERARAMLKPQGALLLTLPDAGSLLARTLGARWWSVIPTHVHYFTRTSVLAALKASGFTPLALRTAPKSFSVGYYLGRIEGYSPRLSTGLVRAARAGGIDERQWAPDFRDRMLVIAGPGQAKPVD